MSSITFLGHSTVLVQLGATAILTDPVLGERLWHLRRHAPAPEPPEVDAVLISHAHMDHLDLASLRSLPGSPALVVPSGASAWLGRRGFERVTELAVGEEVALGDAVATAVEADHEGRRSPGGLVADSVGYLIRSGGITVWFAGDTGLFDGLAALAAENVDLALVPVWGWGTTLGSGSHLDPEGAAEAVRMVAPRRAVPIHWGTFLPVGRARSHGHLLTEPPRDFARAAARLAPSTEITVLEPGEALEL